VVPGPRCNRPPERCSVGIDEPCDRPAPPRWHRADQAAAALAGRYAPVWRLPARSLVAAVVGGLLLGYGARLAYGCNIGAYFSGIVSGSLHGWLWLAAAFAGNVIGTRLRPLFGLEVERIRATGC
jgi:hypothetical protein